MREVKSNYNKRPCTQILNFDKHCVEGWDTICNELNKKIREVSGSRIILVVECYHGLLDDEVVANLRQQIDAKFYFSSDYMLEDKKLHELIYPDVTEDEVFGYITRLRLTDFFDKDKLAEARKEILTVDAPVIVLYGTGAALLTDRPHVMAYFDMPRWEIQLRFRNNEVGNLGVSDKTTKTSLQYKQAFFVDWRVCDKFKKTLFDKIDFIVDTTIKEAPKMLTAEAYHQALKQVVSQPFRLVPFFDPGPWGGQWMKKYFDLDSRATNYAWCFDCVPEENSLLLKFGEIVFETPAINLVFRKSIELLGNAVQARFGDEFPIRFDLLDTMEGGNLSLQVHPTTEYIQENFGMHYTQDESYYLLDTMEDAVVYLGLKEEVDKSAVMDDLKEANKGGTFDADKHVQCWPVKKHDHILIPAGTIHCSGKNSMVLEISATPYIFTFKLWDWGRMGLDGKPRPINIEHGEKVIDWKRDTLYAKKELINRVSQINSGDGWREEKTGLHEREYIETRRHWFTKKVTHYTYGSVNVLNLVKGCEVIVESPANSFKPFIVHYAETFVIPEAVKVFTVKPSGESMGQECATIKAFVRTNNGGNI